jgi:hypothetical protein
VKEATIGLRLYANVLERDRAAITLEEDLAHIQSELNLLRGHVADLENQIERSSTQARLRQLFKFVKKPGPVILLLTFFLVAVYLVLRNRFTVPDYAEIFLAILGILGLTLTVYQLIQHYQHHTTTNV